MYTSHFTNVGDLQTAFYDLGKGAPFVLVHGFTGSKLDFTSQIAWFVETHRVIAFDQRGHGESSNLGPYSLDQLATDLLLFLDQLEIPTCHVLGHSMGGMVVMRALLRAPERFRSAILMDTAPEAIPFADRALQEKIFTTVEAAGPIALFEGMRQAPAAPPVARGIEFLGAAEHWRRIKVKLEQMDSAAFVDLMTEMRGQNSLLEDLAELSLPTTILVGESDAPFRAPADAMHAAIPDSRLVVIPNAAHSPQYENADVWRDAVLAHLAAATS